VTKADVWVAVLGPLEVRVDGVPIAAPQGRLAVLLTALAVTPGRPVSTDALAAILWADDMPDRVRGSLQSLVMRLRRILGRAAIDTTPDGYLLAVDPDHVDMWRFRQLAAETTQTDDADKAVELLDRALRLWRRQPSTGGAFEALGPAVTAGLAEEWLAVKQRYFGLRLNAGHHAEIVADLRELTGRYPLREPLWQQLMTALTGAGRRAEAIEVYQQARAHLRDELGVDPSPGLRERLRQALSGEPVSMPSDAPGNAADRGETHQAGVIPSAAPAQNRTSVHNGRGILRGTTAAEPAPPRQLPADVSHFAGRQADLEALDRLLAGSSGERGQPPLIIAIHGTAGVGKSALAIHWAHRIRDRFPDGQLYLNLHGHGPTGPVTPNASLSALLRMLDTPVDHIPADTEDRSAALRATLAGRRMLVVLDDARDADQVRPLLAGEGCLVLVTSRGQLRGLASRDGAERLSLDRLGPGDAMALLRAGLGEARVKAEPAAARELVDLCARLPLALRITVERANRYRNTALVTLVDELRDEQSRLDALRDDDHTTDLRAAFSWSYSSLAPAAARLFRMLRFNSGNEISLSASAALAGISEARAGVLLDELVEKHLLEECGRDRYELHDLLRIYAMEQGDTEETDDDPRAALGRMLDRYLHMLAREQHLSTVCRNIGGGLGEPIDRPWPAR
jgi:DNA-binding SARP family transcriptional activator